MQRLDGIYKVINNPDMRKKAGRIGLFTVLLIILLGTISSSLLTNKTHGESGAASSNRLWSSGAELQSGSNATGSEITGTNGSQISAMTTDTTTKRSGNASYRFHTTSSNSAVAFVNFASSLQQNAFFLRAYVNFTVLPSTNTSFLCFYNSISTPQICAMVNGSTKQLSVINQQTLAVIGTGSTVLTTGTWYRVELKIDDTTLASTAAEVRLDGVSQASGTTSLGSGIDTVGFGLISSTIIDMYFDDMALNDTTSRTDNWPGEGKEVYLRPNAAGDNSAWAVTGSANGFSALSETTPDTTTYIDSNTNGQIEDVKLQTSSSAGIGSNDLIKVVQVGQEVRSCDTSLSTCDDSGMSTVGTRLKASPGGTTTQNNVVITGGYTMNATGAYPLSSYSLPGTSTPWTPASIDTAQVGINLVAKAVSTGGGPPLDTRVTSLWLLVEYVPATGGRLWSSGFELNSTTAGVEYTTNVGTTPTIQSTTVRSGTYALQTASGGVQSGISYDFASANSNGPFFVRFYIDIGTANSAEYAIFDYRNSTPTTLASVRLTTSNTLTLYNSSTQIGSPSAALHPGAWYRVEVKIDASPSSGSQIIEAKLNGSTFATSSAQTISTGVKTFRLGNNLLAAASPTSGQLYFDDLAINQNVGTTQNSYPGAGHVIHLIPNANGDNVGWTKSTNCSAGVNYTCVSEVTPDDANTFLSATAANTISEQNITDPTFSSSSTISVVQVGVRFNAASATQEDFRVRLKDASSGTPIESNNISPASTTWVTNATASPANYPLTAYTRPEKSSTWDKTSLTSAQIGVRDVNANTGTAQVSTLWLLVDYSSGFSISGTVFGTDETTADTSAPTVGVVVNGIDYYNTTASAVDGTYTINNVDMTSSNPLTVYLDGSTDKAATFTVSTGANMTGVNLYKDRANMRCDNSCSLTNANISKWDKNKSTDIHATVSGGNLTVDNDWKLRIGASQSYAPGGTVTTTAGGSNTYSGDLTINSGSTLNMAGNALSIGGNYTNSGTFTSGSNTTTFAATTTGKTLSGTLTGSSAFNNLTFNGSGGAWSFGSNSATVNGTLTITNGTVTAPSATLTLNGGYSNSGTFTHNSGTVNLAGSSTQSLSGTMTGTSSFYNLTITNNSGTNASDCELTSFVASVSFGASATIANNYTITTASVRVQYNSGSTYTIANLNWSGQASGTKIYFRNSATSGTWLLNVSGTQTAVSFINVSRSNASGGNTIVASDGTNTDCGNNTNWSFGGNQTPNAPSSLVQKKVTGGTVLNTGDWTNETQVTFTATASDPDTSDTLYLCVEKKALGVSFSSTNGGDLCGSGVAYTGTPVTVSVTITGITDATQYHWQAQVHDAATAYSTWVSYGGNAESASDFGVDTTAPTTGAVNDGTGADATYNDGSLTALSANWSGFDGSVSGIAHYDYSIGTTAGGTDVLGWTNNSTTTSVTTTGLVLRTNILYYTNVRAVDNAGNTSSVISSNGQWVLPQISFSLSSNTVTFSNLNAGNNLQDTQNLTLTTSTNAYGGYVISAYSSGLLSSGTATIPMFAAGSYASPASWGTGLCSGTSCGWGYTSSDTTIQGSNKFNSGTLYAPFSLSAPGDIVADHTATIDGSTGSVSNENFTLTYKVAVNSLQPSATYTSTVYYIATGTF